MATCPKCMGFLDEGHRCPGGLWSRVGKAILTVIIGAAIGTVLVYAIEDRPVPALWLAGAALGAVLAMSIRQAIGVR
ncbi:MAG TPA: hypothetical protein VN628_09350 [Vicinamibacterales bacterium]|nr:hypothetical protein [Vicinamibacterales bacterium]